MKLNKLYDTFGQMARTLMSIRGIFFVVQQVLYNNTVIVREELFQRYCNTGSDVSLVHISDLSCLTSTDILGFGKSRTDKSM